MYHSQRSHLRAALGHLYHEALVEDHGNDSLSPKIVPRDTALASQVSSPGSSLQNALMDHIPHKIYNEYPVLFVLYVPGYFHC